MDYDGEGRRNKTIEEVVSDGVNNIIIAPLIGGRYLVTATSSRNGAQVTYRNKEQLVSMIKKLF